MDAADERASFDAAVRESMTSLFRQRTALILTAFVDLSVADTAHLMGVSAGRVKATVHAARGSLAKSLGACYARD